MWQIKEAIKKRHQKAHEKRSIVRKLPITEHQIPKQINEQNLETNTSACNKPKLLKTWKLAPQ